MTQSRSESADVENGLDRWVLIDEVRLVDATVVRMEVREDALRLMPGEWQREVSRETALDLAEALDRAATVWPPE